VYHLFGRGHKITVLMTKCTEEDQEEKFIIALMVISAINRLA